MPFSVKKIKGIDTSDLEKLGASVVDLAKYTEDEFSQVASALQGTDPEPIWNKPPPKPRRGTIIYADGTNWNPGAGEGAYFYNSLGQWVPMSTSLAYVSPVTIAPPSGGAYIYMSPPAGQQAMTNYYDGGVAKWQLGKQITNEFILYDVVNTSLVLNVSATSKTVGIGYDQFGSGKIVSVSPTGGVGYATGAGGAVTQITSRTTAVTINKITGSITMLSAAGSTTWSSFTVNNSTVAVTDTIALSVRLAGATNGYLVSPVNVAAGSFVIMFVTNGGTAVDAPTINFTVIKGSNN